MENTSKQAVLRSLSERLRAGVELEFRFRLHMELFYHIEATEEEQRQIEEHDLLGEPRIRESYEPLQPFNRSKTARAVREGSVDAVIALINRHFLAASWRVQSGLDADVECSAEVIGWALDDGEADIKGEGNGDTPSAALLDALLDALIKENA